MPAIAGRKRGKLAVLITAAALVALLSLWIYWGNSSLQVSRHLIQDQKITEPFHGFTIVQVSDLHNAQFGRGQAELIRQVRAARPDLIAVTGDLVDSRRTDIGTAMEFIEAAVQIAPVYYVTGNHESRVSAYAALEEQMQQAGVTILHDRSVQLERGDASIRLSGLDDPAFTARAGTADASAVAEDTRLQALADDSQFTILLSHRPELFAVYAANNIDLVLCGHAHGGQIRLPLIGGLVAPNQGFLPKYSEGIYKDGRTDMIVSRGLGNSLFPFRINNRPELVIVTLMMDN
jgi:predicted MPP superfamily phosphohydrolase